MPETPPHPDPQPQPQAQAQTEPAPEPRPQQPEAQPRPQPAPARPPARRRPRPRPQPARPPADPVAQPAAPAVVPPRIRVMTVCLPDDLPTGVLAAARCLDRHLGVPAATCPRFWVNGARRWQHRQLIDLRAGRPAYCAGGPVGLLDLAGMRQAAAVAAGIRYQTWTRVVAGTHPAVPWAVFAARHLADPHRYPADRAAAEFARQPRVAAIRLHNAASPPAARLDLTELDSFQTGPAGYTTYHALSAGPADALLTAEGHQWRPATGHLSDRISYLQAANQHLDTLHPAHRLLAITL